MPYSLLSSWVHTPNAQVLRDMKGYRWNCIWGINPEVEAFQAVAIFLCIFKNASAFKHTLIRRC